MKVLLTGAAGQLGHALRQQLPGGHRADRHQPQRRRGPALLPLDLADAAACRAAVLKHRPTWVLNAGVYTAVDKAESEPELALADTGGRLLQVNTDFVFNGQQGSPYRPDQSLDPLGPMAATKAAGEEAVEQVLGGTGQGVILRTSWVIGPVGKNFALTMLRLHRERGASGQALGVVEDQVGCPTSWFDVAVAVGELAQELGLLEKPAAVNPLTTAEYPLPALRPLAPGPAPAPGGCGRP